jgi:hypothetical protein
MKTIYRIILIIFGTCGLMLLTSWLLSWSFIAQSWVRQAVVMLLMVLELFHGFLLYQQLGMSIKNQKQ